MKKRSIFSRIRQRFFGEKHRGEVVSKLINKNKFKIYAEVGVWDGDMIQRILKKSPGLQKFFLIDPYDSNIDYEQGSIYKKGEQKIVDNAKELMLNRTEDHRVVYVFKTSLDAAKEFVKNGKKFDLVFIDALHTYDSVKQDISLWLPLIVGGGILSGHDYNKRWKDGVVKAVDELFDSSDINVEDDAVWWVRVK